MSRRIPSVTGNVIENAPSFGIIAGWGKYLRDVAITGNVIRNAFVGIGVSVMPGAGTALVNNNMISETPRGAVVGLDHARTITTDLSSRRRAALRAGGGRRQRGAAVVLLAVLHRIAQQRDSAPSSHRARVPATAFGAARPRLGTGGASFGSNERAFRRDRNLARNVARWRNSLRRGRG